MGTSQNIEFHEIYSFGQYNINIKEQKDGRSLFETAVDNFFYEEVYFKLNFEYPMQNPKMV